MKLRRTGPVAGGRTVGLGGVVAALLLTAPACGPGADDEPDAERTPGCDLVRADSVRSVIGVPPERRTDSSGNVATSFLECTWSGGVDRPSLTLHVEQDAGAARGQGAPPRGCRDAGIARVEGYVCPVPDSVTAARSVARWDGHVVTLRVNPADTVPGRAQLAAGLERVLRDVEARLDDGDVAGAGS